MILQNFLIHDGSDGMFSGTGKDTVLITFLYIFGLTPMTQQFDFYCGVEVLILNH